MTQATPAWAPLMPVAMVGTDRHAGPMPAWPGEIGAAIAALASARRPADLPPDIDQAAAGVLRAAAILATCGMAGARPMRAALAASREAAAVDANPTLADPAVERWLAWALRDGPDRLKQAFLVRLGQAGLRLPAVLLPAALELARHSLALRTTIQPLLGERGVWLARQREDWQFAAGVAAADDDERTWSEGTLEQRKAFFAAQRRRDPAGARARLVAALPEMPARERADLARGLAIGLGPDDEALLDQLRGDRSQDVRAAALDLLLRLPDSGHAMRAAARLAALMSRGSLLTGRRWIIEPPAQPADDWKADQVEAAVSAGVSAGLKGERAWWLHQLVRQVPLAWWTSHTGMSVADIAAWADRGDWAEALWTGWRDVLRAAPDRAWAEALLDDWPEPSAPGAPGRPSRAVLGDRSLVLWVVAPEVRERHFERRLKSADAPLATQVLDIAAGCAPGETVSARLAPLMVARVKAALAATLPADAAARQAAASSQDAVGRCLAELCCVLPLASLADFDDWPSSPDESAAIGRARHESRQIIQARRALDAFLP